MVGEAMISDRFLIISTNKESAAKLTGMLDALGVSGSYIAYCADRIEAEAFKAFKPTVIFLPDSGNLVAKAKEQFPLVTIIALFNKPEEEELLEAINAGAHHHIEGDYDATTLEKAIKIGKHRNAYDNEVLERSWRFERIKDNSRNAIFLTIPDGTILEANQGAENLFGYTLEEFKKIGRQGILDHDDPRMEKYLSKRSQDGTVIGEITGIKKNGERFDTGFSSVVFKNNNGELRVSTILMDISERVKSEKEKDILIKSTEECFALLDKDLFILEFNNQFEENYKRHFGREVHKGDSILDYAQPERREIVKGIYEKVLGGEVFKSEITVPSTDGQVYYFENIYKPAYDKYGVLYGVFVSSIDITDKVNATALIKASEKRFRTLIENSEDMILLMDENRTITYISPSFTKQLGYTPEEVIGERPINFTHPQYIEKAIKVASRALENPGIKYHYGTRVIRKDGEYVFVEGTIINQLHIEGVNAMVNNFIDVTREKEAKELLEASETRYRTLFHLSPSPMFTYDDTNFEFIEINKAALDFYGYTEDEMRQLNVVTMRPDYDRENTQKNIEDKRETNFYQLQTVHAKQDGTEVNVQVYNNKVAIDNKVVRLVQIIDITPLLAVEEERERANKVLKELNAEIQKRAEELEVSNIELRKIAWMQSHLVRAPLARIMGLIEVLDEEEVTEEAKDVLLRIKDSAIELDLIIREIVKKTDIVNTTEQ